MTLEMGPSRSICSAALSRCKAVSWAWPFTSRMRRPTKRCTSDRSIFGRADSTRHSHAVEYVSQPGFPWQKLRSEHPGQYEAPVVPEPDGDQWFHVRVVVAHAKISVFVNDAAKPALVVNELSDRPRGSVGLWVGDGSAGVFANLRVTRNP